MSEVREQTVGEAKSAWFAGCLAWVCPGAGHFYLGRGRRGLLAGGLIGAMFVSGLYLGGHLYGLHNVEDAGLLAYVFGFCDLGSGILYLLSNLGNIGLRDQSQLATAEYGNVFLMVAGLLNYRLMLDAYDIGIGRKS